MATIWFHGHSIYKLACTLLIPNYIAKIRENWGNVRIFGPCGPPFGIEWSFMKYFFYEFWAQNHPATRRQPLFKPKIGLHWLKLPISGLISGFSYHRFQLPPILATTDFSYHRFWQKALLSNRKYTNLGLGTKGVHTGSHIIDGTKRVSHYNEVYIERPMIIIIIMGPSMY